MTHEKANRWTPDSNDVTEWRLNIGRRALDRREALRDGLALAGPPGLLSVFETLIHEDRHLARENLLGTVHSLCRPDVAGAAEELLDFFTGDDPRRHLWKEGPDGYYQLLGPCTDFPN